MDLYSSVLPINLMDGEVARWFIPLKEKEWLKSFSGEFKYFPRLNLNLMKIEVFTSNGEKFQAKIGRGIMEALLEELKDTKE